jgi:type 1 glutamine amidotransferase
MRRSRSAVACAVAALLASACSHDTVATPPVMRAYRVLVFTKCVVYCHASIPAGAQAIRDLGDEGDFDVDVTDDATVFDDAKLDPYAAVVFLSTTVENDVEAPFTPGPNKNRDAFIMTADQQSAFERYVRRGRGYVGIHAASDGDYKWDFYVALVGGMFKNHATQDPTTNMALLRIEDANHPATAGLGATWMRTDEWYNFKDDPRPRVHVLLTLDESAGYQGQPRMGGDHPIAWCQEYAGGRSFYTALGHQPEAFAEPLFRKHLAGGIAWAAGRVAGDCSRP